MSKIISIKKIQKPEKVFNLHVEDNHNYVAENLVVSNCHRAKAKSLTDIMIRMNQCEYRFGFTGTLDESLTNQMVLEGLFGQVERFVSTSDLIEDGTLSELKIKCITLDWSDESCKLVKGLDYHDEIKWLENNSRRNNFIKNLALSLKGNVLLLFHHQEHGERLHDMISKESDDRHNFLVYGKTDVEEREDIRKIVNNETDAIVSASFFTFSEGVNIPNLRYTILAFPVQKKVKILQSIGRGLRKSETKDKHTLYDIIDNLKWKKKENYALKHYMKRHDHYLSEGFPIQYYKVNIK